MPINLIQYDVFDHIGLIEFCVRPGVWSAGIHGLERLETRDFGGCDLRDGEWILSCT